MKILRRIILIICLILVLAYAGGYVFFLLRGKHIIVDKIRDFTSREVALKDVRFYFPLRFELRNIEIEGLFKAESVSISPSVLGLLAGKFLVYDLAFVRPEVSYTRGEDLKRKIYRVTSPVVPARKVQDSKIDFLFKRLTLTDATIVYADGLSNPNEPVSITAQHVNLKISNMYEFPETVVTHFEVQGDIPWKTGPEVGKIKAQGWINLLKRDSEAKILISDIDALTLYPYYSSWVNIDKSRIEKAKLSFKADVNGLNNEVTAACHFELGEMVFKPATEESEVTRAEKIAQVVLDIMKSMNEGKVVLDFTFKTTMDNPQFGLEPIRQAVMEKVMQGRRKGGLSAENVVLFPGRVIEGTAKSVGEASKSLFGTIVNLGKELTGGVKAAFKKHTPVENQTQPVHTTNSSR
ncbi:MAG TPA: DUF748 domain-containing protein [Candidatus Omnitrophota bacterium]|nr:DUF748 domain-containing protein [Candidatus Omnitrophota bacterium]